MNIPERHTMTQCGHMVEKGHVAYRCTRPMGHIETGEPHYAVEVPSSARAWSLWVDMSEETPFVVDRLAPQHVETKIEVVDEPDSSPAARLGSFHHPDPDALENQDRLIAARWGAQRAKMVGADGTCDRCQGDYPFRTNSPALMVLHKKSTHPYEPVESPGENERVAAAKAALQAEYKQFLLDNVDQVATERGDRIYLDPMDDGPAPTKQRQGDQPLPGEGQRCVQDQVIADMIESKRVGLERYGSTLQSFNGRRGIQDVHEEVRDLYVYLTQIRMESEATRDELVSVVEKVIHEIVWGETSPYIGQKPIEHRINRPMAEAAVDAIMGWVAGHRGV